MYDMYESISQSERNLQNIRIEVDTRDLFVDRPLTNLLSSEQIEQSV